MHTWTTQYFLSHFQCFYLQYRFCGSIIPLPQQRLRSTFDLELLKTEASFFPHTLSPFLYCCCFCCYCSPHVFDRQFAVCEQRLFNSMILLPAESSMRPNLYASFNCCAGPVGAEPCSRFHARSCAILN